MIHLSKAALREVNRLKSKQSNSQTMFRLGVKSGGCAGLFYTMDFEDSLGEGDQVWDCDGLQVVIDKDSSIYLNGLNLDYAEDLMGGGFRFHNPNAAHSCGCGHSFNL